MDDRITIRTSDDPRVELKASRAILIAGSRVFADRLSLPQGDSMRTTRASCDVAETEENFKPFLRLLNLVNEPGDPLEELRDEEWMAVVPLSDKYDSPPVRGYARAKYCCDPDDVAILWYTAALDALKNDFASSPDYPFRERMRRALPAPEFCQRHRIEFDAQADALGWAYFESTPDILL
ncbi:hypothetical protein JCM10450v2_002873 [Rhodotorula kratochvilovae]